MKRIRINKGTIGVVSRNKDFRKILLAGKHFISMMDSVMVYDMSMLYVADKNFELLKNDKKFLEQIEIIEIKDSEVGVLFKENLFDRVLESGRYFFFKGLVKFSVQKIDLNDADSVQKIDKSLLKSNHLARFVQTFTVSQFEAGLLFINGKFDRKLEKGMHFFTFGTVSVDVQKIDLRSIQLELSGQEILTKDKASLRLNFFIDYNVVDSIQALVKNKNFEKQLYTSVQLALREFVGTLTLDELLSRKEKASEFVLKHIEKSTKQLGVNVSKAGIRDIILSGEMKEIMNRVLIAQKNAEANNIARREETAATRSLLNTAKLMEENEMLFKLKEMEYIEKISSQIGEVTISNKENVLDQFSKAFTK